MVSTYLSKDAHARRANAQHSCVAVARATETVDLGVNVMGAPTYPFHPWKMTVTLIQRRDTVS